METEDIIAAISFSPQAAYEAYGKALGAGPLLEWNELPEGHKKAWEIICKCFIEQTKPQIIQASRQLAIQLVEDAVAQGNKPGYWGDR